jgi:VWFA-related protein
MKFYLFLFASWIMATAALAQTPAQTPAKTDDDTNAANPIFRASTNLVLVPALVRTKSGEIVFSLTADDFTVKDNGVEQKLSLETDTDDQPLALVIVVETGGAGARHLDNYRQLGATLDAFVGGVVHSVAVVGFDSTPRIMQAFTPDLERVHSALAQLQPGDDGAAILDSLGFAVDMLRSQPPAYRRAILLLSETLDHGSQMKFEDALRAISDTNTAMYTLAFSGTRAQMKYETGNFSNDKSPAPPGGCMSKSSKTTDDDDSNTDESGTNQTGADQTSAETDKNAAARPDKRKRAVQAYDCATLLLPPLLLVKMATEAAIDGMHRNVPQAVARQTGGEYYKFDNIRPLQRDLVTLSNHVPNRYVLTFSPQSPTPGLHALEVRLKDHPGLSVEARKTYWADSAKPTRGGQ